MFAHRKPTMKWLSVMVLCAALVWLVPTGLAQDDDPTGQGFDGIFGTWDMSVEDPGALPVSVVAGGVGNLSLVDWTDMNTTGTCEGFFTIEPTIVLRLPEHMNARLFFVPYETDAQAGLYVIDWTVFKHMCPEDGVSSAPLVDLPNRGGPRDLWVHVSSPRVDETVAGVLYVFADRDHTPESCAAATADCGTVPDPPVPGEAASDSADLNGEWVGQLTQEPEGGFDTLYGFQMSLTQTGHAVEGTSRIESVDDPDIYGEMTVTGVVVGDLFIFWESEILGEDIPEGYRWCEKRGKLNYDGDLQGSWSALDCEPGEITLSPVDE
jgi:hypothetical protein